VSTKARAERRVRTLERHVLSLRASLDSARVALRLCLPHVEQPEDRRAVRRVLGVTGDSLKATKPKPSK